MSHLAFQRDAEVIKRQFNEIAELKRSLAEAERKLSAARSEGWIAGRDAAARAIEIMTMDRKAGDKRDPNDELFYEYQEAAINAIRAMSPPAQGDSNG